MRGPHNIWRLIVTGATLERTGAMGIVLDAMDAPRPLRIAARTGAFDCDLSGIALRRINGNQLKPGIGIANKRFIDSHINRLFVFNIRTIKADLNQRPRCGQASAGLCR